VSGVFGGGVFHWKALERPEGVSWGKAAALREFRPSYKRAAPQQAILAIVCFLCGLSLALLKQHSLWVLGGSLVGAVVPFTFIFTVSTNRLLLDEAKHLDGHALEPLLKKWARLHAVRTVFSLLGFLVLLWACVFHS
jgi:hypothetical protein